MRKRSKNHPEVRHRNKKPRVAFICVHNSCRSQIAEALGKHLAADVFESCSAGTHPGTRINANGDTVFERCCITIRFFIATSKWRGWSA